MGLFDAVTEDFSEIQEFVAGVPAGTYEVLVAAVETERKDSGNYLVLSYTITEGSRKGKTHKEFLRIVEGGAQSDGDKFALQALKTRLKSLGVPDDKMRTVGPDDLVGVEGVIVLVDDKKNPQYRRVIRFTPVQAEMAGESLPSSGTPAKATSDNPFA